jgi:hypothetical protein
LPAPAPIRLPTALPGEDVVERIAGQLRRELAWTFFEPNGEPLWRRVRNEAEELLIGHWRAGELLGDTPDEAFSVACDHTTMTEDDVATGRLVLVVGLAVVAPAEFVEIEIEEIVGGRRPGRLSATERSERWSGSPRPTVSSAAEG